MHLANGGSRWRIEIGDRQAIAVVLWLRDASGMAPDLDPVIPPLEPAVAVRPELAALAGPRATAQWTGLWLGLWEGRLDSFATVGRLGPPGFELLNRSPELRELFAAGFPEAMRWSKTHRPLVPRAPGRHAPTLLGPGEVVKRLETELGRQARDFEFAITVLPVAGRVFWMLPDGVLAVSENLVRDPTAFSALLYDVLSTVV
ncbi:MAG: hypothetical protein ACJ786_26455 [Catenulispora sp.]